ncbi:hypothetical protein IPZ58_28200 [Streptomyces roseoverticillatus]|uniref:pentapeptide repeat-containing protein n=1 Tax=Streptomyces roseoverticillatus TaxID=66429 RepID=UPI001F1A3AB1|nr:hypothetical protein [Streptomyces roseoverticillatus]MCF3105443.1 hypothetical protein [Streptomyces roseoverticillatus]
MNDVSSVSSTVWTILGPVLGAATAGLIGFSVAWFNTRRQRETTLNERFATASRLLGDEQPAVQLAGVHAMAGLADDWTEQRQTCVNVLCAYLRIPFAPEPADNIPLEQRLSWQAARQVRHTVIAVIREHLLPEAKHSWAGLDFDFTGAQFDGGCFDDARFSGGHVIFDDAHFTGGEVLFDGAEFTSGSVTFAGAVFAAGEVRFDGTCFDGTAVYLGEALFDGSTVRFDRARFTGGEVRFGTANFSSGTVSFEQAEFAGSAVLFDLVSFTGSTVTFNDASFTGGLVSFYGADFTGGEVDISTPAKWDVPAHFDDHVLASRPSALRLPPEPE